jgi:hypothetical protein
MGAVDIIEKLTLLLPILLVVGAGWKFLPKVRNVANEVVIPVLNALITFFTVFVGPAQAGLFGDIGKGLSTVAAGAASMAFSVLVSLIHDKYIKPLTPPSPYRPK